MHSGLFVSLVYCAESTVRWFVVREKHCWMAADSADKSKRTGQHRGTEILARSHSTCRRRHLCTYGMASSWLAADRNRNSGRATGEAEIAMC
jgi:hypothetical protein